MRTYLILCSLTICLLSCKQGHNQGHRHGSANEYMHRSSIEQLIANFESPARDEYQRPDKVIEFIGPVRGLDIMDLGAGSGYFSFRLAQAGARVIAADVNEGFQAHIQKKLDEYGIDSLLLELRLIPYDDPSLAPEEVDKVLLVNTYHHIEERIEYFKKVRDGLKEGGELVVIDYFKKDLPVGPPRGHKISREIVVNELEQSGFSRVVSETDLLPYQYIVRAYR